jgi:integrase
VFKDQFQTLKSDRGTRLLPIGPCASQVLAEHRQRSIIVNPDALLFPWKEGRPYSESYLLQEIVQPAGEAAGLGKVTWHQFRHIHSSQLHNMGVPAKIAQQQLGHASISTTFNMYTHVIDDAHRTAICDLEGLLFPSVPRFEECRNSGEFVN